MGETENLPLVTVLTTGGTIASSRGEDGAASPTRSGQDLLGLLGQVPVRLRVRDLLAKDSSSLTLADMQLVSDAVGAELADPEIAGVVVLHGTDAMEETALLVQLQHAPARPVIFTGAQFAADHPQADGPGNLAAALAAAGDHGAAPGVALVFGGRRLAVWGLYKASTEAADAFRRAADGVPALPLQPAPVSGLRVDIVAVHPGGDGLHLDASLAAGADGIVLAALGSGNGAPELVAAIRRATARGVPVIVSSRVPEGGLAPVYGGGGGGHDMMLAGAIHARILRPGQARILLAALLANGATRDQIARAFAG